MFTCKKQAPFINVPGEDSNMQYLVPLETQKKKGQVGINNLPGLIMSLVVVGVILVAGFLAMSQLQSSDTIEVDSAAYNATGDVITALQIIPDNLEVIVLMVVLAIIIGVVFLFGMSSGKKRR